MSEQRIEIVFCHLENNDGSYFVEAEVSVNGSIVFEVRDSASLVNTARNIIKHFGDRTRVWVRWEYQAEYYEREARRWDDGNGNIGPVLMSPTNRLC